ARRWRDRGAQEARRRWIDASVEALGSAAARGEEARSARTARFALLLDAERWDDAYAALRELRAAHDPQARDAALIVAEASLLAGGLRRDKDALGLLAGLQAESSTFDAEHRVTGWLLAGQIQLRQGLVDEAIASYGHAVEEARSESGRSEATL